MRLLNVSLHGRHDVLGLDAMWFVSAYIWVDIITDGELLCKAVLADAHPSLAQAMGSEVTMMYLFDASQFAEHC